MTKHRKGPATPILIEEYQAGASTPQLARKYGMHHAAIQGRLKRAGIKLRPARARALYDCAERTNEAVRLYTQEGLSMASIARRIGVSHSTVQRALAERGVATRPNGCRDATIHIPRSATDIAYMAGLFDGEGNLQIRGRNNGSVATKLAVYSTTPAAVEWVAKTFGGSVRWDHKRHEQRGWKPMGIWEIYRAQDVGRLLVAMMPYLIIKRAAARKALRHFREVLHLAFTSDDDPMDAVEEAGGV